MNSHLFNRQIAELLRGDLGLFVRRAFSTLAPGEMLVPGWHVDAMAHVLQRVALGDVKRLIITVPPRHLKSITASVALPAAMLGADPSLKFLVASYGAELASKHARDFKLLTDAAWFRDAYPKLGAPARNAEGEFMTSRGGGRKAVSLGGALTGFGADIIIVDDLMKASDAHSPTERERVRTFYEQTLVSRLNNKREGRILVVQQRLHEDDLVGFFA